MDPRLSDEVSLADLFEQFVEATTMRSVLAIHHKILNYADLSPCDFNSFFPKFKRAITAGRQKKYWKAKALFSKIDKRAAHKCYSNTRAATSTSDRHCDTNSPQKKSNENDEDASSHSDECDFSNNHALKYYNCLVIGSGPAGLRTAIELQLLGASRVVIVEKRGRFSRNNVLHLWPFVIDDLKSLGAKKFYGKFCAGSIDHISIRQLQLMLLKICLMIGCDFRDSCSYMNLCPASLEKPDQEGLECDQGRTECCLEQEFEEDREDGNAEIETTKICNGRRSRCRAVGKETRDLNLRGARAHFQCDHKPQESELHSIEWDIILGADGRRNTLSGFFPRIEFRGRLAIAITANFINRQTPAETSVPEISGLSFIYNQDMFNALAYDTNIQLENICYYKDDTHYFVMTAKKRSLLERGVLIKDYAATKDLLSHDNVDKEALLKYAKDAAFWTTGLEPLDFALNHYGQEDCAMFDFTSMYAASNACRALRTRGGGFVLLGLVGDSLLEPFWPTGSGCARGFLSSFDAAWMCRQWAVNQCAVIDHHAHTPSRSNRIRNIRTGDFKKFLTEPATYDRMAMNVVAERESIYRILAQTTSENLHQNYSHWTLNPHTRYPNLNRHLITPGQVEHLVASSDGNFAPDSRLLSPKSTQTSCRVKSPTTSTTKSRRSPKKLKSAGASPSGQPKNARNHHKANQTQKSKSRNDINVDDFYLEFEESYRDLDDSSRGRATQYLNYKERSSVDLDNSFIPSLSGTLPSSNNLSRLEARRARDIDECLRQRRQKSKIHIVRDQLISQMRGEKVENGKSIISGGNAVLFNEIKRMREQQSRGLRSDSKPRDASNSPMSLLNSIRRCASFAERVKSFESKLSNVETPESVPTTPKTPIDNVKNLPQFATLQELIVNNVQSSADKSAKKSKLPVAKLSKEDWNVKCWEHRLSIHKQNGFSLSSRSLNKAVSVDSGHQEMRNRLSKPKMQADVFQDRIKAMAGKLDTNKENIQYSRAFNPSFKKPANPDGLVRSQGWINHLKRELSKGSDNSRRFARGQPMNPTLPRKPIKKLFEDEDDDDHGIDINKHYDHLCINRPTNKYLPKGSYTSHLARTKYNSATSKVINQTRPTAESKQAYLANLASRGSSASSTLSDHSTSTGNSSSVSAAPKIPSALTSTINVECFRCKKFVSTVERITVGSIALHHCCLTCSGCGLTLRANEIQHYLSNNSPVNNEAQNARVSFMCDICQPHIKIDLTKAADTPLASLNMDHDYDKSPSDTLHQRQFRSREEFLSSKINYHELYKNILNEESTYSPIASVEASEKDRPREPKVSPSQLTSPMKLFSERSPAATSGSVSSESSDDDDDESDGRRSSEFSISETQTIDGKEQVTVILSSGPTKDDRAGTSGCRSTRHDGAISRRVSKESEMIDEEELQRILHLDNRGSSRKSNHALSSTGSSADNDFNSRDEESENNRVADDDNRHCQREGSSVSEISSLDQHSDASSSVGAERPSVATDDNSSSLDIRSDSE